MRTHPAQHLWIAALTGALLGRGGLASADELPSDAPATTNGETAPSPSGEVAQTELVPTNERVVVTYRWPRWIPWSVLGGGVAIAGIGFLIRHSGSSQMDEYDRRVQETCSAMGCNLADPQTLDEKELVELRDSAERRHSIGFVTMLAAGAVALTGGVLVLMNRPERHVMKVDLVPAPGGGTATVGFSF